MMLIGAVLTTEHLKPFQYPKGVTGNPGGRPKGLERLARDAIASREYKGNDGKTYKGEEAGLAVILDILFDERNPPRERVVAFNAWADRAHGKAKARVEVTPDTPDAALQGKQPEDMTDDEIAEALAAIRTLRRLGAVSVADDVPEH